MATYQASLVGVLRGHTTGQEYLELWVPDEDPIKSILNMIEAAQSAGRETIAIEVSLSTFDSKLAAQFALLARKLGDVSIESHETGYLLSISSLRGSHSGPRRMDASIGEGTRIGSRTASVDRRQPASDAIDPTGLEVNPALTAAIAAQSDSSTHEGTLAEIPRCIVVAARNQIGELAVWVDPDHDVISAARHRDIVAGPRRVIAEMLCQIIEGRTVQEASDHGGIVALHRLTQRTDRPMVAGIVLPRNAGRAFVDVIDLVRQVRDSYAQARGLDSTANFFALPPDSQWTSLTLEQKMARARSVVEYFARAESLPTGAICVDRIEKDLNGFEIRVVITLNGCLRPGDKPGLVRALERELKRGADEKLQLYLEPVKDRNKIRRL